jgi:glyoxylase-like metal-dependent hydrolase (beta-lactamase superfamily II)
VEPPFTLKQVGPNIWAAIHNAKAAAPAWANAGFVIGDDGVAVIDTFASEATATALLAEIRARTTLPVKFVINTHYHSDHVAGNVSLPMPARSCWRTARCAAGFIPRT